MNKLRLKLKLLSISLLIGSGTIIFQDLKTVATPKTLPESSPELLAENIESKNYVSEKLQSNNSVKSSSQRLVGSWIVTGTNNSGEKYTSTIIYSPDGTYLQIYTANNGNWFIQAQGTWRVSNNILYENLESGEKLKGSVKFTSNNEFLYQSDKGKTKWQRVNINKNLSANQLLGTWSIRNTKELVRLSKTKF